MEIKQSVNEEGVNEEELINELFRKPGFKFVKNWQMLAAAWPYTPKTYKIMYRLLFFIPLTPLVISMVRTSYIECGVHLNICGQNVLGTAYILINMEKYVMVILVKKKFIYLFWKLSTLWKDTTDPDEKSIYLTLSEQGKKAAIIYCMFMCICGLGFALVPTLPLVLDTLFPLNESRDPISFVETEWPFDPNKHFTELFFYYSYLTSVLTICWNACDSAYIVLIYQITATFDIVKHRLHQATLKVSRDKDTNYDVIRSAIQLHQEVIDFGANIESTYDLFFIALVFVSVMFMSIGSVYLADHDGSLTDLIRFLVIVIGSVIHLLLYTLAGQIVVDRSSNLLTSAYCSYWYNVSPKSKKLIQIFMMRCSKPIMFRAKGLYVMNLENFGTMIRTAASYITVIASYR